MIEAFNVLHNIFGYFLNPLNMLAVAMVFLTFSFYFDNNPWSWIKSFRFAKVHSLFQQLLLEFSSIFMHSSNQNVFTKIMTTPSVILRKINKSLGKLSEARMNGCWLVYSLVTDHSWLVYLNVMQLEHWKRLDYKYSSTELLRVQILQILLLLPYSATTTVAAKGCYCYYQLLLLLATTTSYYY